MWRDDFIQSLVKHTIEENEGFKEQEGEERQRKCGTYVINTISSPKSVLYNGKDAWKVEYRYSLKVDPESITDCPDNLPYEYKYKQYIIADIEGNPLFISKKVSV